ncbi:MAG: hypothetical protein AMXMBFR48_02020 [Ignavibacteriales bacterium]
MKNFFLALFAILLSGMSFTQTLDCITAPPEGVTAEAVQSGNLGSFARTTITPPLRLAIHVIRPNDGTGGISTQMLNDKLNELYEAFEPVLFEFEVHSTSVMK